MKEILKKILKEDYDFGEEREPLSFSCGEISCESAPDRQLHGSFSIYSASGASGYVWSDDLRIRVDDERFFGKLCEIRYTVDTSGLAHGSVHTGALAIVSDHGEYELPYRVAVSGRLPDSSLGEIRNLFHFANLAKADWNEAAELFYSERFKHVLGGPDAVFLTSYRGFSAESGNPANMESFLQVSRKKSRPVFHCDTEQVEMMLPRKSVRRHLRLSREGWGYLELKAEVRGEFLALEQDVIDSNDFTEDTAQLSYVIERSLLHPGENRGEILIHNGLDEMRIPVTVRVPVAEVADGERAGRCRLMKLYIDYRIGRMDSELFAVSVGQQIEDRLAKEPEDLEYRLYQAQLLIMQKRTDEAKSVLDRIAVLADEKGVPVEQEAYRLYLQSRCTKDEEYLLRLRMHVEELYRQDEGNWRLAWAWMNMDPAFEGNERKRWKLIKEQYEEHKNASPVMLLEAFHIIMQAPKRMDELGEFELALMRFALRKGILTAEMKERLAMLSMEVHSYSEELCGLLQDSYEPERSVVLLEAICLHLIRGNRAGEDQLKWYRIAVERELRLSRLYEYYICSLPLDFRGLLPRIVLMYFAYRSPLDTERNAFLYANVLRHKNDYQEVYEQYLPVITEFSKEQLLKGRVDENLAYIYKKLFSGKKQESDVADAYTELLFAEELRVKDPGLVRLIVVYEHLTDEKAYPFFEGHCIVPLYGDRFCLLLEDESGNRYTDEDLYERRRFLKEVPDLKRLVGAASLSDGALLCLAESGGDVMSISAENAPLFARLSASGEITDEYRLRITLALAEYYFDNDEIAPLDELILGFDLAQMQALDRERCIRIMVARGFYEEAYDWIMRCGIEGIDVKILVRLCDRLQARTDQEFRPGMLKLCQGILKQGRYDEDILNYLLRYGHGVMRERKELWRAADSFGLDVQELLESMMLQLLFSGVDMPEKTAIYLDHLGSGMSGELEKAYLCRLCYDQFILQGESDERVFRRIQQLYRQGEELKTVCLLGWLKNAAPRFRGREESEEERETALEFIARMHELGIFLPFFTSYAWIDPSCRLLAGQSFIEYRGRRDSHVVLHYAVEHEGEEATEYCREEMQHVFGGIYLKRFVLFFGERVHYYITEEDGRTERLTRSSLLEYNDEEHIAGEDRFFLLNNIAIALEMKDELTFMKLFGEYDRQVQLVNRLFLPAGSRKEQEN